MTELLDSQPSDCMLELDFGPGVSQLTDLGETTSNLGRAVQEIAAPSIRVITPTG